MHLLIQSTNSAVEEITMENKPEATETIMLCIRMIDRITGWTRDVHTKNMTVASSNKAMCQ